MQDIHLSTESWIFESRIRWPAVEVAKGCADMNWHVEVVAQVCLKNFKWLSSITDQTCSKKTEEWLTVEYNSFFAYYEKVI